MKYFCDVCNYETNRKSNFETHIKGIKHSKKESTIELSGLRIIKEKQEKKKFICKICNTKFTFLTSLSRHKKTCNTIENIKEATGNVHILINKITELEKKNAASEQQIAAAEIARLTEINKLLEKTQLEKIELLAKENTTLKTENEYHKKLVNHTGNIVKNSMNTLNYLMTHHTTTPVISPFDNCADIDDDDEHDIEDIITYHYNNDTLVKFLGDYIVKCYKKDDHLQQSLWNTDISRFNYAIRKQIENENTWITDKRGIKTIQTVVVPLLKHVETIMTNKMKNMNNTLIKNMKEMSSDQMVKYSKQVGIIANVAFDVAQSTLETEIIKYISPYFHLDQNTLKIDNVTK